MLTVPVFFFQAEDGIRGLIVTGVQTCALPIFPLRRQGTSRVATWLRSLEPPGSGAMMWFLVMPLAMARSSALARVVSTLLLAASLVVSPAAGQERPVPPGAPETELPTTRLPPVEVIGATPLPALGIPIRKYPGNVQSISGDDLAKQNPIDLSDMLHRNIGSVNINGTQSNPWQNDVTYRGFLASPLTGSAIGLSVYLDGMRFNDGFGDTINWDLIPQFALAGVDIIPGSNPLFGLNTLGGAISMRTKRGFDFPGFEIGASGGSWGRWDVEGAYGGSHGPFDWFLGFNVL